MGWSELRDRVGGRGRRHAVLGAAVAGFALAFQLGCSRDKPPGPARDGEQPLQITRGFTTTESDSGLVRYVLRARIARFYTGDITRAEDVQVDFYDAGKKVSVLTSREGFLDADGRLRAQGNVVVRSQEGYVLETEKLYWDRGQQKIRSDDFVRITKGRDVLTGYGLTTGPNLDLIDIDRDVQGTVVEREPASR
jgi:LPS export ABC transporter protein LptC